MTRTGRSARLLAHAAEPVLTLAPADARHLGMADGALARLTSEHGGLTLRAAVSPAQRPGEIWAPMHWTDAFAACGPVARVVGAARDPISGQPELKATAVRVEPVPVRWRGLLLHRRPVRPEAAGVHWSRVPLNRGHALELTGSEPLPSSAPGGLAAWARRLLESPAGADHLEVADPGRGAWRFAALVGGRLEACLFLAAAGGSAPLPSRDALANLLGDAIAEATRPALLAGRSLGSGVAAERTVCACFSVGLAALRDAVVARRLSSVAEIGTILRAGTNCGSCIPELREILRDAHAAAAA
jgi:assimilatory nitrate reductase catalytic subunit